MSGMTRRAFLLGCASVVLVGLSACSEGKSFLTITLPYNEGVDAEWLWQMSEVGIIEPTLIRSAEEDAKVIGDGVMEDEQEQEGRYATFAFETVSNGIMSLTCQLVPRGAPIHVLAKAQWNIQVDNRLIASVTDYSGNEEFRDCIAVQTNETVAR